MVFHQCLILALREHHSRLSSASSMWYTHEFLKDDSTSILVNASVQTIQSNIRFKPLQNCLATGSYQFT